LLFSSLLSLVYLKFQNGGVSLTNSGSLSVLPVQVASYVGPKLLLTSSLACLLLLKHGYDGKFFSEALHQPELWLSLPLPPHPRLYMENGLLHFLYLFPQTPDANEHHSRRNLL
ncbi:unnamed protein product, partial [Prunus brigantina]